MIRAEITNTLAAPTTTGLQRVATELMLHADRRSVEAVTYDEDGGRLLTGEEERRLRDGPSPRRTRPWRAGGPLAGALSSLRRGPVGAPTTPTGPRPLPVGERRSLTWRPADVFVDLDAGWHHPPDRSVLLPDLARQGVVTAVLCADVLPFEHPEWFVPDVGDRFRAHVRAHLTGGSTFLCISRDTASRLRAVAAALGTAEPVTAVIALGSDPTVAGAADGAATVDELPPRYVLCVGTVEPRKNYDFLLDVMASLTSDGLGLVIVGRLGWHSDRTARRLRRLNRRDPMIRWFPMVDDARLEQLYAGATVLAAPSLDEGLGLPVLEARCHGVPVVASNRGGLPEASAGAAVLASPDDQLAWRHALHSVAFDAAIRARLGAAARSHPPVTWAEASSQFWTLVGDSGAGADA